MDFVSSNWRDIVNVVGVIASLAGLGWTIRLAWQAKTAAEQARDAAREARDHVLRFDLIAALSAAIAALDEIKGLHRIGAWEMALIRYGTVRKLLVTVESGVDAQHSTKIGKALSEFRIIERRVERAVAEDRRDDMDVARLNDTISSQIDELGKIVIAVKRAGV